MSQVQDELKQFEDGVFISVVEFSNIAKVLEDKYKSLEINQRIKQAKRDFILIKRVDDELKYIICEQEENLIQVIK